MLALLISNISFASQIHHKQHHTKDYTFHSVKHSVKNFKQIGIASWYGPRFHGKKTANGERYNQNSFTAAHTTLPFGTKIRVINIKNGKSVIVRINDRGAFLKYGRILDMSKAAAKQIGIGVGIIKIERV
jgi:rare lipoprotein A